MTTSDPTAAAAQFLDRFSRALQQQDIPAALALFGEESYWRDLVAFTWNIVTLEGKPGIADMLAATLARVAPSGFALDGEAQESDGVTQARFTFETAIGRGKGHFRLRDGKAWTLLTALRELKGFEEKQGPTREHGTQHGAFRQRRTWSDERLQEETELGHTRQPYCLIVGGGQGGIGLGARLKRLGVPTLIIDKNERPGDAWRKRYKSLCLHDPVWYDHMPYLPFPDHWPIYTPKDKMGDWLEAYTRLMELNYWPSTECRSASYDPARGQWSVTVARKGATIVLEPKHLILATGMSGVPNVPAYPGAETFKGTQHHSSRHSGGEAFAGKKCVVVGSNNSAHDIAADLWEHGAAEVTMLQRSPTLVVRSETQQRFGRSLYSEEAAKAGITTDMADLTVASMPYRLGPQFQIPICSKIREADAPFYESLRKAGFKLTFGEDDSGLGTMYLRRGSGYYIDVGASELIADGRIGLKSGVSIERLTENAVVLSDGTELQADLVVYATGYGSMNGWAAELISPEVAEKVGPCWGLGSGTAKDPGPWEGELRNMWKPTAQDALWFHGGNLAQSRHYSIYVALQLKARLEGIPTPVYRSAASVAT
jgi:putative flavoprotein involved in K+ transport